MTGTPLAVVIGGVNIDIGGRSFAPLVERDSNPGRVTVSLGGVGRNLAHNLRLVGIDVSMLTALGDDLNAQRVASSCAGLGIDISRALVVPGGATSTYIYLDDADGDMALALSDMEICARIDPAYLSQNQDILAKADVIVADANIPAESLCWITEHCSAPLFTDPVSTAKAEKLRPILSRIHTLKPNRLEAELLSGVRITDDISLFRAARALLDTGLNRAAVTLGGRGILAADAHTIELIPVCPAQVRNATGAGDAFMAALVWSWQRHEDFPASCRAAAAAAAIAVESEETINPALSPEAVLKRISAAS